MNELTPSQLDVMRRALRYAIEHPAEWDQEVWGHRAGCRTAYCLAGHVAVTVRRAAPVWSGSVLVGVVPLESPGGAEYDVEDYARNALGLTPGQADQLFDGGNSLRRLAELCYRYSRGAVDLLDQLPAPTARDETREESAADESYEDYLEATGELLLGTEDPTREKVALLTEHYPDYDRVGARP